LPDDEVPVDVWVCEDGLIHKVEMTLGDEALRDEAANAEMTLSFEMYDLGADIAIEVPTDAEKLDFGDLLGGLGNTLEGLTEPDEATTD
ncbi:MAG TPA: hypothetical protein VJM33_17715, partial [Microthrixaceae bacterium]|nr:hypothetical protein [Microthrixaceae bacterium]